MLIALDSSLHQPLYLQIRDRIRERIASGALKPGDRLEPSRELAKRLGVHRTTVGNAYAELESEGLIAGRVGRGTFISPLATTLKAPRSAAGRAGDFFWSSFFTHEQRDDSLGRLMASACEPGVISFAVTHGSGDSSAVDFVRRSTDAVLRREGSKLLEYGSSDGYPPLKRYLQNRMRRDGIPVETDEILITNGCQQSLDLLRRSLVGTGDVVACENPTYPGLWNVFEASGVRMVGVPVGPEGMDLDYLAAVLDQNKVKLILASPNFQNPTGRTMPLEARKRLLALAARYQTPVAEDDIYGGLRYRGRELPPLKALDNSGLVIYLNSFSKVGFPGLRVGWVAASRRVIERLRSAKQRADLHTNLLGQAVLEELGRRGWLDKLVRRTRKVYERKLSVLLGALGRYFPPEARWSDPEGGMAVWVELPAGLDAVELLVKAQDRGVIFAPSRYFYFQEPRSNAFRLCYTALNDEQIEAGIGVLGEMLRTEVQRNGKGRKRQAVGAGLALV
ncbi:MAG TPA: PLP-dependent aminotransferase family protein [Terriglobia bacterium]|nr:PLP-dependent aminotransferase family protein [Terriglobia bacterium]